MANLRPVAQFFHAEISGSNSGQFADGGMEVRKITNHAQTLSLKRGEIFENLHGFFYKFLSST